MFRPSTDPTLIPIYFLHIPINTSQILPFTYKWGQFTMLGCPGYNILFPETLKETIEEFANVLAIIVYTF